LREDCLFLWEKGKRPALADGREECVGIEIEVLLLGRRGLNPRRCALFAVSGRFGFDVRLFFCLENRQLGEQQTPTHPSRTPFFANFTIFSCTA
jgi:hypothetical protein